jgi:DNA modification methylase
MTELRIETVNINSLTPDPANARKHDGKNLQAIAHSLEKFGQRKPICVTPDSIVVAGNGTLEAAKSLGWTEIVIARTPVGWTWEQIRAFALADNRTAELAEWDDKVLADQLLELDANGWELEELGFENLEPNGDLNREEDDSLFEPPVEPITKLGDIWKLGNHLLLCGDVLDSNAMNRIFKEPIRLLVTDPPYGVDYSAKNEFLNNHDKGNRIQKDIANDSMDVEQMYKFWKTSFSNLRKFMDSGASYYVFSPSRDGLFLRLANSLQDSEYLIKHEIIWVKNNHVLGRTDYHYKHEPILYGWVKGGHKFYGGSAKFSVWNFDKPNKSNLHPTMKPVEIYEEAINNSSLKGEIVADIFAGSGTMVIAAEKTGRIARCVELDPAYCDVIVKRWEELTGNTAELFKD